MSGGLGGGAAPPICKTSSRMAKRYFLLSLAEICLLRSCPKKNERGGWGGRNPPICKTYSKMRAKKYRHVVSCSALLGLACECGAINMSGGGWGGAAPPIRKTSNRMAKRYFLLSLAKICLFRSCPKKMSGGVGGGAAPPICKTSNKMRTCRFLLSLARFCENMSFLAQRC